MENFLQKADEEKDLNVNNNDLQGLWDMSCIEIDDLETKFKYLDMIKANNWKKTTTVFKSPNTTKKRKLRKTQRNSPVTSQKELVKSVRSSTAKSSEAPLQEQIVIDQIKAKKQIYDKRKSITNKDKYITSDNEDKYFDAKSSN
ncbi:hypothetical protein CBL_13797 [Carabus blaptoides fortunei]